MQLWGIIGIIILQNVLVNGYLQLDIWKLNYMGCFKAEIMVDSMEFVNNPTGINYTIESCSEICRNERREEIIFCGLWGNKCYCISDRTWLLLTQMGTARNDNNRTQGHYQLSPHYPRNYNTEYHDDSQACEDHRAIRCLGNEKQICGGLNAVSVYANCEPGRIGERCEIECYSKCANRVCMTADRCGHSCYSSFTFVTDGCFIGTERQHRSHHQTTRHWLDSQWFWTVTDIDGRGYGNIECSPRCLFSQCHNVLGYCYRGCLNPADKMPYCRQTCLTGLWGEYCENECTQCARQQCDAETGVCLEGCKPGYSGERCEDCEGRKHYGHLCSTPCHTNCKNGECNMFGECRRCNISFYGYFCEYPCEIDTVCGGHCDEKTGLCTNVCRQGFFGPSCRKCDDRCVECDSETGFCTKCPENRTGDFCSECSNLTYSGAECNVSCRDECVDKRCDIKGTCIACYDGTFGDYCELPCSANCLEPGCDRSGACSQRGCMDGYHGEHCDKACPDSCRSCDGIACTKCPDYLYSDDCSKRCPDPCPTCDLDLGICIKGCPNDESYDSYCQTPCPANCISCEQADGICKACKQGWRGARCEERCDRACPGACKQYVDHQCDGCGSARTYGYKCELSCPETCLLCEQRSGDCLGCRDSRYYGPQCQFKCDCGAECDLDGQCPGILLPKDAERKSEWYDDFDEKIIPWYESPERDPPVTNTEPLGQWTGNGMCSGFGKFEGPKPCRIYSGQLLHYIDYSPRYPKRTVRSAPGGYESDDDSEAETRSDTQDPGADDEMAGPVRESSYLGSEPARESTPVEERVLAEFPQRDEELPEEIRYDPQGTDSTTAGENNGREVRHVASRQGLSIIIGGVIASIVLVILIALLLTFLLCKYRKRAVADGMADNLEPKPPGTPVTGDPGSKAPGAKVHLGRIKVHL